MQPKQNGILPYIALLRLITFKQGYYYKHHTNCDVLDDYPQYEVIMTGFG